MKKLNVAFCVVRSNFHELSGRGRATSAVVMENALGKATHAKIPESARRSKSTRVIGADTMISFRGKIIGKPKTLREAFRMLSGFSGRSHSVYTGVALVNFTTGRQWTAWDKSTVYFHRLSPSQIKSYLRRIHPLDKAGGYAVQDSAGIVRAVRGSYSNVMGLPVELLRRRLRKIIPQRA